MRPIIIESPFRGNTVSNLHYLNQAVRDSLKRGEAPFASHRIYPHALDDEVEAERALGIEAGYAWWKSAHLIAFYTDLGWSDGMRRALYRAKNMKKKYEERKIL
jgi:hypothetical protein